MKGITLNLKRVIMFLIFALYSLSLIYFLFFSGYYGREIFSFREPYINALREYLETSFNPVPFATVRLYIRAFRLSAVSNTVLTTNLLGNFMAFMPFSVFVPYFFKQIRSWYKYLIFIILTVFCIEILQLVLMSGVCDIDDLILNVSGAMVVYILMYLVRRKLNLNN